MRQTVSTATHAISDFHTEESLPGYGFVPTEVCIVCAEWLLLNKIARYRKTKQQGLVNNAYEVGFLCGKGIL